MIFAWTYCEGVPEVVQRITAMPDLDDAFRELSAMKVEAPLDEILKVQAEGNLFFRRAFEVEMPMTGRRDALYHADMRYEYGLLIAYDQGQETHISARLMLINRIKISQSLKRPFRVLAQEYARDMRFFEHATQQELVEYHGSLIWLAIALGLSKDAEKMLAELEAITGGDMVRERSALLKLRGERHG